jgi:hypothetical protein
MIYMVAKQYKNGELRFMHSGRSRTPFATENLSAAKAMATHAQRSAWKDVSEVVIFECDFRTMDIMAIDVRPVKHTPAEPWELQSNKTQI